MNIKYATEPVLIAIPLKNEMMLHEDWYFCVGRRCVWIPAGYIFNGASIPGPLWPIGSPFEPCLQAGALAHDFLYLTHLVSRSTADDILYHLLRQGGKVNSARAHVIWLGVRGFGQIGWHNFADDRRDLNDLKTIVSKRSDKDKFII